jgi:hypothetical protein
VRAAAPPAAALVIQATILQYRHQFGAARGLLQKTLEATCVPIPGKRARVSRS